MQDIVRGIDSEGYIYFERAEIFDQIVAACKAALWRQKLLRFVHNGITVWVSPHTVPNHLFCAWLEAQGTGATRIGPDVDPLIVDKLVEFIRRSA